MAPYLTTNKISITYVHFIVIKNPVTYSRLPDYVVAGDPILLCDGEIEVKVIHKDISLLVAY